MLFTARSGEFLASRDSGPNGEDNCQYDMFSVRPVAFDLRVPFDYVRYVCWIFKSMCLQGLGNTAGKIILCCGSHPSDCNPFLPKVSIHPVDFVGSRGSKSLT